MPKAESEEEAQKKINGASKIKKRNWCIPQGRDRHAAGTWLSTLPLTFESHGVWAMQYSTASLTEFSRTGDGRFFRSHYAEPLGT
jgi:hypothetical protein